MDRSSMMEVPFMKSIAVNHQPPQDRMEVANRGFNAPAQPGQSCVRPSCAHMEHINMLLACPAKKMLKTLSPGTESIQESQGHGRAFIGKTLEVHFNSREPAG